MRLCTSVILVGAAILIALGYQKYQQFFAPAELPDLDYNFYWGRGDVDEHKDNNETTLQELRYGFVPIDALRERLRGTLDLPPPLEGTNFEYGMNSIFLSELVKFWLDDYLPRWLGREVWFNKVPHYTTYIQG